MTDVTPNRPLWHVMHAAYWEAAGFEKELIPPSSQECFAAELRAIADRIEDDFATHIVGDDPVMEVVDWLRAEAGRAEAGE